MLDNDDFTYSFHKSPANSVNNRQSERALITLDRAQKMDLLIHLLTNLQQSLIVCGPSGIGKTTLLKTFEESQNEYWPIYILQGSSALSFEAVVTQLSRYLKLTNARVTFDLTSLRAFCETQKVILIIDDAEHLMPGLIGELMDFADSLAGLRLVLAMNNDALQAKINTDVSLNACHVIEIPPLNQQQCLEYLQNLTAHPSTPLSFNAITDALVANLYQETQGIPGKLIAQLSNLDRQQSHKSHKYGLWLGIFCIIAVAGFTAKTLIPTSTLNALFGKIVVNPTPAQHTTKATGDNTLAVTSDFETNSLPPTSDFVSDPLLTATLSQNLPAATTEKVEANSKAPIELNPSPALDQQKTEPTAIEQPIPEPAETVSPTTESASTITEEKSAQSATVKTASDDNDLDWIMAQPGKNYTIQVMTLSSKASATRYLKKNTALKDNLKYYAIGKSGQERYVIIYGSFLSATDALNQKPSLPNDFQNGLVKRFSIVQKQSQRK